MQVTLAMEKGRIATTGPFGVVRSPSYTGFVIMCAGACVMAASPVRACITLLLGVVLAMKAGEEEEAMLEERGEMWSKYCKSLGFRERFGAAC